MSKNCKYLKIGILLLVMINVALLFLQKKYKYNLPYNILDDSSVSTCQKLWDQTIDFWETKIDNETGTSDGCYVVPNYVHFIRLDQPKVSFADMVCILAAFKNQKPDKIFFHKNINSSFEGKYWEVLTNVKGFMDIVVFNYVTLPKEIFGQPFLSWNGYSVFHAADVVRIQVLMKFGGIILDHDTYVVRNLDGFRKFEMTLNWDEDQFLGCQILIAHKDARFLKLYLDTYHDYRPDLWYYNAGERPTTEVLYKMPDLVYRVKVLFGLDYKYLSYIYESEWPEWRTFYSVHLLIRHLHNLKKQLALNATYPVEFNEDNVGYYPVAFREMVYDVYDTAGVSWPKNRFN